MKMTPALKQVHETAAKLYGQPEPKEILYNGTYHREEYSPEERICHRQSEDKKKHQGS